MLQLHKNPKAACGFATHLSRPAKPQAAVMNSFLANWYRSTFGYAAVSAVMLWAALPPLGLWPLAWIAPVWWIVLIRRNKLVGRRPYAALWTVGFLFWLAVLHWLRLPHPATGIGWVALSFYFAFYLPLFIGLSRAAVHRLRVPVILAAPIVWCGLELARAHVLTGMTMACLGHTQYRWIELIQIADLAGPYGVGFVVMFIAACLARMVSCDDRRWAIWPTVPAAVLLAATLLYGYIRINVADTTTPPVRVALIQGSIDTQLKADPDMRARIYEHYRALSEKAIERYGPVDLIVWPETMFRQTLITCEANALKPDAYKDWTPEQFQRALEEFALQSQHEMGELARTLGTQLLLGVDNHHFGPDGMQMFNAAAMVRSDGKLLGCYRKNHLVMFGEYVPLAKSFAWLQKLTPLPVSIDAGRRPASFRLDGLRIAPNICYESVLSHFVRRQVNTLRTDGKEPDVLVNLTNDGWFWGSSELDLHLICGVFRAVECRKPFLIAANTGFSAWIDGNGRILSQGPRRDTGTILAKVRPDQRDSWYLRHGDLFSGACLAACVLFGVVGIWCRVRRSSIYRH